jgi:putative transposase
MRGFGEVKRTQAFRSRFGPNAAALALSHIRCAASLYRKPLAERFAKWHRFTALAQKPSSV